MSNNLLTEFLNNRFCDIISMKAGVIMVQSHTMMSFQSYFSNCGFKTMELFPVNLRSDGYITRKQFIVDYAFFVQPDAWMGYQLLDS